MPDSHASINICLMRHAKSDWDDPSLGDHDRPLNKRGRRDAPRIARWLAAKGYLPEVILGSTAVRVRQTIDGLLDVWNHEPPGAPMEGPLVMLSQSLYMASPSTIADHIASDAITAQGHRPKTVLLVAHNPGISQLVSEWSGASTHMPTAAVAIFQCEPLSPDDIGGPRVRRMIDLARPKGLGGDGAENADDRSDHRR